MKTSIDYNIPASTTVTLLDTPTHSGILGLTRDQRVQAVDRVLGSDFVTSEDETHEDAILNALDAHRVLGGATVRDFRASEAVSAFLEAAGRAGWEVLVSVEYDCDAAPYTDFILVLK